MLKKYNYNLCVFSWDQVKPVPQLHVGQKEYFTLSSPFLHDTITVP